MKCTCSTQAGFKRGAGQCISAAQRLSMNWNSGSPRLRRRNASVCGEAANFGKNELRTELPFRLRIVCHSCDMEIFGADGSRCRKLRKLLERHVFSCCESGRACHTCKSPPKRAQALE